MATALMLCPANRVETRQGDPRGSVQDIASRKRVVSYGNRLFCDADGGELFHRWGSVKLYRAYYEDYRKTKNGMLAAHRGIYMTTPVRMLSMAYSRLMELVRAGYNRLVT